MSPRFSSLLAASVALGGWARADFIPTVSGTPQVLGNVTDPTINRDSCVSVRFGDRTFWTCRDSQPYDSNTGAPILPVYSSSASWTDFNSSGQPNIQTGIQSAQGNQDGLLCYGENNQTPFFPIISSECSDNSAGACSDGTRWAIWPDSPPLVTEADINTGAVGAYTWIHQAHLTSSLVPLNPDPPTTLYLILYTPTSSASGASSSALPTVSIVNDNFWTADQFPYGVYGGVVSNGSAYLYGQNVAGAVGLAKVPAGSIQDQTAYQYYVNGAWTSTAPGVNDTGINIENASAGGQGTYYFSSVWNLFVWIGQASGSIGADFYITTAPAPEGPWAQPTKFYSGESNGLAYSLQAHPGLLKDSSENAIYLSWTTSNSMGYYTTLVYVEWE
ncbi:hypothetical protein PISL3812_06965 [Talaromyces islandicus]|uniref:DUF4185 domain-containing protein n=1 Tax=Talaromyces islandicus TaxID=28573 RepID=A0A0U1M4G9_TALIS|nr:hypothetical protein PISL3812_06965 [Talaromyces islandicus]